MILLPIVFDKKLLLNYHNLNKKKIEIFATNSEKIFFILILNFQDNESFPLN